MNRILKIEKSGAPLARLKLSSPSGALRWAAAATIAFGLLGVSAHADYSEQVLATGLNNPRGLAISSDGSLYITEAGSPFTPTAETPSIVVNGATEYYTTNGSIVKYSSNSLSTVASNLPTLFNSTSGDVTGAQGIAFDSAGNLYYTIGLGANPSVRTDTPLASMGLLMELPAGGGAAQSFADISGFEAANNPAGGPFDSNPYQILSTSNGLFVADAGGNDVPRVSDSGVVSLAAVLPPVSPGVEPVPTGLAQDSLGNLYVSELTGFPFPAGGSTLYRLDGSSPVAVAGGFTNAIDLTSGPNGMLYLLEFAQHGLLSGDPSGALWEVDPANGDKTLLLDQGLTLPSALAVGADGTVYITNNGAIPGQGELIAFHPVPEPATYGLFGAGALLGAALWRRRTTKATLAAA